ERDFNIHQLDQAAPYVFARLSDSPGKLRSATATELRGCGEPRGFMSSVAELVDDGLAGRNTPKSLCYIYNGQRYALTLERTAPVAQEKAQLSLHQQKRPYVRTYHDLLRMRFDVLNETTHKRSNFELLMGTSGTLRGVPVRISYQPNWWFQVVLNL